MASLKLFFSLLLIGLFIDYLWIGVIAKKFYLQSFAHMARTNAEGHFNIVLWAGLGVYILLMLGVVLFVLPKFPADAAYLTCFIWGAIFGLIAYGVYDLTNHATLAHWPLKLVLVDMIWGSSFIGIMTVIGKVLRDKVFFV